MIAKAGKNGFLDYKSAGLSGGATGADLADTRAWTEATLYFSAPGVGAFSSLLPCVGLSWFVTFGPFCKELIDRRSWPGFVTLFFVQSFPPRPEHYYLACNSLMNELHQCLVFERFCKQAQSSRIECGLAH